MDCSFDVDETWVGHVPKLAYVLIIFLNCATSRAVLELKHYDVKSTKVNRNVYIYFNRLWRRSCYRQFDLIYAIDLKQILYLAHVSFG